MFFYTTIHVSTSISILEEINNMLTKLRKVQPKKIIKLLHVHNHIVYIIAVI